MSNVIADGQCIVDQLSVEDALIVFVEDGVDLKEMVINFSIGLDQLNHRKMKGLTCSEYC